ncbi:putative urate catabolism protein [Hartmannibacter diazotrophicus]|uniref:Chitooligosaccharide deacetylase n=1 Tax=Hartmannibacter diazotrophicus TaxID=1482074 RepID=A0A2C9D8L1_9HYPH|nr:polysaccharide deacetylase family protein [Hartmannibacter diazotrophicus]SON56647.1 putative urate catabolism protein [Hartmannibacter diazotrophicus]
MPWKDAYTSSNETTVLDEQVVWPNGARLAFNLVVNLNPASGGAGITDKDIGAPTFHFGMHEGLDAFLALFSAMGLKATFAVPALVAEAYPERIRAIAGAGHEIAAQGLIGEDPADLSVEEETWRMTRTADVIEKIAGTRPLGWYGLPRPDDHFATGTLRRETVDTAIAQGFSYIGNGLADDLPYYWVTDPAGPRALVTLPYYYHLDDTFFLLFPHEGSGLERPSALLRNWKAEFAAQYRRGRAFPVTISPARSGWGHRFAMLETFLRDVTSMPGLFIATGSEIAAHWTATFPAATTLNLKPSIWRDHADSLS